MFGFFKNKTKDKVVNKDKNSDGVKEKKKDKTSKEDKEIKVNVRKGKDEKSSRSIFRKSKSIERAKEGNEGRKSQSLDSRDSGGWSDHEQLSRQDSGATESEEAALSPGATGSSSSSSEEAARPSETDTDTRAKDGDALKNSDSFGSSLLTDSLTSSQEGEVQTEALEERKYDTKHSLEIVPTIQTNSRFILSKDTGRVQYSRTEATKTTVNSNTKSDASTTQPSLRQKGVTSTLVMKPPLNPRLVAPRGPLATTVTSFNASLTECGGERDESRLTPSPGIVTPPASPGLHSSQLTSLHQNVTNPSSRPTSPDGRTSMLSTPSSSTSSLSSLTARPISPSGRRTPPGPRMGTGGRLTSSPTANRKAVRTNIKTNPSVGSRRAGSHSPVNSPPSPGAASSFSEADNIKTPPSSPVPLRQKVPERVAPTDSAEVSLLTRTPTDFTSKLVAFSPPIARRGIDPLTISPQSKTSLASPPGKAVQGSSPLPLPPPRLSVAGEEKPEGSGSPAPQRSVSPTVGKTRHSISSMHSLESIPENDSDGQSPVTGEKTFDGDGKLCQETVSLTSSPKEHVDSSVTRPSRHSAPEVTPERQYNHGITHRRSSSLTPVNEERRINFSVSISETKTASSPLEDEARRNGRQDGDAEESGCEESASRIKNCDNLQATNTKENKDDSKEITNSESNEGSIDTVSGSSGRVTVEENPQESKTKDNYQEKPSAHHNTKENETATHVVFRIPFQRTSLANGEEGHQRASVEILTREAGRTKRREKEHCKERPRSVSTSRELRRERTSERLSRKRILSEGTESKNDLTATPGDEGRKEGTKERVRCRSASSSSSRRIKDHSSEQTCTEVSLVSNGNDSYDGGDEEVIIPWRKAPRSRSSVLRTEGSSDAVTTESDKPLTTTPAAGMSVEAVQEGTTKDENPTLVTAPPRQRSKSRGSERRMTRSLTMSEIKQATDSKTTPSEHPPQRRARSSSRLQDTCDVEKPTLDGASPISQVPQRRKVSTKRRSMSARREGEEKTRRSAGDASKTNVQEPKIMTSKESHRLNHVKAKSNETTPSKKEIKDTEKSIDNHKCSCKKTVETKCVDLQTLSAEVESKLSQTENDLELRYSQQDLEEHTR